MTIHLGITGTREGCTGTQWNHLAQAMGRFHAGHHRGDVHFHFGDCVGVDEQGFHLAKALGFTTVAHAPLDPSRRAYCDADEYWPLRPYMTRNQQIVDVVSLLIVVPSGPEADNPRSGTWATYRMAVKAGVETVVIEP